MNEEKYISGIAEQFIESGYRGTTTAMLAKRLKVRENVLYRVWPSKSEMFLASIEYIFDVTFASWQSYLERMPEGADPAEWLLRQQAENHGQMGLYRLVYAGILEDDPQIRSAVKNIYQKFHQFISQLLATRPSDTNASPLNPESAAWALIGLGAIVDLQRELDLASLMERQSLLEQAGGLVIGGLSGN